MRDPNRIAIILAALNEYWMKNPDLRLGQMVANFTNRVHFTEDEVFLARLLEADSKPHGCVECGHAEDLHKEDEDGLSHCSYRIGVEQYCCSCGESWGR